MVKTATGAQLRPQAIATTGCHQAIREQSLLTTPAYLPGNVTTCVNKENVPLQ